MSLDLPNLESQVQNQADDLANQIRTTEDSLMRLKESFLKVQGAKEMLGIIGGITSKENKEATDEGSAEAVEAEAS